jgi:uncharacterized protein YjiS (DUF1127 family)
MTIESIRGGRRISPPRSRRDEHRSARRPRGAAAAALALPFTGPVPRVVGTRPITPLVAIRRIAAAIRRWRNRARALQQLDELSDHLLKDIGLRREDVGYAFPKPFWYRD